MKKIYFSIILFLSLLACKEEITLKSDSLNNQGNEVPDVKVENGRLSFKDSKTYFKTIETINRMSEQDHENWTSKLKIKSLRKYFDANVGIDAPLLNEEFLNYSIGYLSVLNENAEVEIGDTLVWYNKGIKHFAPKEDERLLAKIRSNPASNETKATYSITRLGNKKDYTGQRVYLGTNQGVGGYQYEFNYCLNGALRKYVNELYTISDNFYNTPNGYGFHTSLYIIIKLEWKGKKSWNVAGESRKITYDITTSLRMFWSPPSVVTPISGYITTNYHSYIPNYERTQNLQITLFDGSGQYYNGDAAPYMDVEVRGYIEQSITDAYPVAPGGNLCNTWRIPSANAGPNDLLW